ncbi:MAG: redoxin family protein [Bacteroidales bacterium]|nr:redoxin family protein [Bacteroidales bacterium]MDD3664505.1 redoxin family protein [Bacteroidales bacterium]
MKSVSSLFLVLYLFFSCFFVNFDRISQVGIVAGLLVGFTIFRDRRLAEVARSMFLMLLPPFFGALAGLIAGGAAIRFDVWWVLAAFYYVAVVVGLVLRRLPLQEHLSHALLFGIALVFVAGAFRKVGLGWSAVVMVVVASVSVAALLRLFKKRDRRVWWFVNLPYLFIHLIFSPVESYFPVIAGWFFQVVCSGVVFLVWHGQIFGKRRLLWSSVFTFGMTPLVWVAQENLERWNYCNQVNSVPTGPVNYTVVTPNGDTLNPSTTRGKQLVCLFWSAQCGSCPAEFPYFSDLASRFAHRPDISFVAVFLSTRAKDSLYYQQTALPGFAFRWGYALNSDSLMRSLNMQGVPHFTIFNAEGGVSYNGMVMNRPWLWLNRPARFIE